MSFNIGKALTSGIQAFEETGNPWVGVGAAAIGGFSGGNAPSAPGGIMPQGNLINELLGELNGGSNPLSSLLSGQPTPDAIAA